MTAPPKVALFGCGQWGRNLARNFAELGALAAISDADPTTAQTIAGHNGVQARALDAILADATIPAVVIATPANTHAALAQSAMAAGKHVFLEKPMALSVADAEALAATARDNGRILMIGHLLQYHPGFIRLRQLVSEGVLGRLQYIYSNRLNLGRVRRDENILWSMAPHDISMILALFDEMPDTVSAIGHTYLRQTTVDTTMTHLAFPGGRNAHIFVSWLHPFKEQKLVVIGEKGMAVFEDTREWGEKLLLYPHAQNWRDGEPELDRADAKPVACPRDEPLRLECQHFLDCVVSGHQPRTNGEEGVRVMRVLEAAQQSLTKDGQSEPGNGDIHSTAVIDQPTQIGARTRIWHFTHILPHVTIGEDCVIGQNAMIGPNVHIGNHCKIQNNVSLYQGVTLEDGVFCGPACVFTNVKMPRAEVDRRTEFDDTLVKRGATIGANATIVCGITLGEYCFIGAGAVVTKDVPPHA
ncbi:MAG: Gfo/Idh/MocA family oxidoreductase, partial [Alphaproteobacteria bacterium]